MKLNFILKTVFKPTGVLNVRNSLSVKIWVDIKGIENVFSVCLYTVFTLNENISKIIMHEQRLFRNIVLETDWHQKTKLLIAVQFCCSNFLQETLLYHSTLNQSVAAISCAILVAVFTFILNSHLFSIQFMLIMMTEKSGLPSVTRIVTDQWFRYSDKQKVELFLFGSTELTNSESFIIFSHVQHFIM